MKQTLDVGKIKKELQLLFLRKTCYREIIIFPINDKIIVTKYTLSNSAGYDCLGGKIAGPR